jgi:hypothetical protein
MFLESYPLLRVDKRDRVRFRRCFFHSLAALTLTTSQSNRLTPNQTGLMMEDTVKILSITLRDKENTDMGTEYFVLPTDDSYEILLQRNVPMPIYCPANATHSNNSDKNHLRTKGRLKDDAKYRG